MYRYHKNPQSQCGSGDPSVGDVPSAKLRTNWIQIYVETALHPHRMYLHAPKDQAMTEELERRIQELEMKDWGNIKRPKPWLMFLFVFLLLFSVLMTIRSHFEQAERIIDLENIVELHDRRLTRDIRLIDNHQTRIQANRRAIDRLSIRTR